MGFIFTGTGEVQQLHVQKGEQQSQPDWCETGVFADCSWWSTHKSSRTSEQGTANKDKMYTDMNMANNLFIY